MWELDLLEQANNSQVQEITLLNETITSLRAAAAPAPAPVAAAAPKVRLGFENCLG
jgi:hypothetical protein